MYGNGPWNTLPIPTFRVPIGVVVTATMALAFQPPAATTALPPIPTTSLGVVQLYGRAER